MRQGLSTCWLPSLLVLAGLQACLFPQSGSAWSTSSSSTTSIASSTRLRSRSWTNSRYSLIRLLRYGGGLLHGVILLLAFTGVVWFCLTGGYAILISTRIGTDPQAVENLTVLQELFQRRTSLAVYNLLLFPSWWLLSLFAICRILFEPGFRSPYG